MKLYENGRLIAEPKSIKDAKKMIGGLDLSMATVDCDGQEYEVRDSRNRVVYYRSRDRVP